jgi:hypothetical protein
MNPNIRVKTLSFLFVGALLLSVTVGAQQVRQKAQSVTPHASTYDVARDTVLVGTVLEYTENSSVPPIGAHVTVQTSSGPVEVHLGDARFLKFNNFALAEGSSVKIIGQSVSSRHGTIFLARIIQQGGQSLVMRTPKGMPLSFAGARALSPAQRAHLASQTGPR